MKTVRQVANDLGVSRQAIYKRLSTMQTTMLSTDDKGVTRINSNGEAFLKSKLSTKQTAEQSTDSQVDSTVDTVISMLKSELEIKNEQIRELNARLAESNAALVIAQQSAQAAQVLHAGTMKKQLTDGEVEQETTSESRGFFDRWFGKKGKVE